MMLKGTQIFMIVMIYYDLICVDLKDHNDQRSNLI